MALITCTDCGHEVSDRAAACPQCGAPPSPNAAPAHLQRKVSPGVVLGVLAAAGAAFLWAITAIEGASEPDRGARLQDRAAIDRCEARYGEANADRRHGRGELALIHAACEQLRRDYREKWRQEP